MDKRIKWPLYAIEAYLVFSLILLIAGPLHFELHNKIQFVFLIIAYHVAFILGYNIGTKSDSNCRKDIYKGDKNAIVSRYTFLIILVLYVWLIVTRNITHANSYIPVELFKRAITGIMNPALSYNSNKGTDAEALFHGNKVMTGSILLIYFLYYCFPAITVLYWEQINKIQRILSVIIIVLCLLLGFASGTNASIFHVIIPLSVGLVLKNLTGNKKNNKSTARQNIKRIRKPIITMLCFGVLYFINNIDSRLGGNVLAYFCSKSSDITISTPYKEIINNPQLGSLVKGLASVQSYICQGYYGMSLAIDKGFTPTYGLGHSFFLATSSDNMFGTNIISNTYQEKITNIWSRTVNWHSFYSQMANDVGFYGVIIIMLILGIITSKVWIDIIINNNPIAKLLFVVMMPIYIFMPMNNQMGNLYGTFFSFWVLLILWIISRKNKIVLGRLCI